QEPALGVVDGGSAEHRGLAGGGVLPHQVTDQGTAEHRQNEEERGHVAASGGRVAAAVRYWRWHHPWQGRDVSAVAGTGCGGSARHRSSGRSGRNELLR